jgi:hypothetical protein
MSLLLLSSIFRFSISDSCGSFTLYTGEESRLEYNSADCLQVLDCFFENLQDRVGGAIYIQNTVVPEVHVRTCTFHGTSATSGGPPDNLPSYGGGLCHEGGILNVSDCCFRQTSSSSYGTAIHWDTSGTDEVITRSTFFGCFSSGDGTYGTISETDGRRVGFASLNFTECRLGVTAANGWGFCLYSSSGVSRVEVVYSTILDCVGSTGIHTHLYVSHTLRFCNFYGNSVSVDGAILYAEGVGMDLQYCIFNGDAPPFGMSYVPDDEYDSFSLISCVFSIPESDLSLPFYIYANNVFEAVTASYYLTHLNTHYCPTASDMPSLVFTTMVPYSRLGRGVIVQLFFFCFLFR